MVTIGKNSTLDIADYLYDAKNSSLNKTDLKVAKGAFHAITGEIGKLNPSKFKLKTSTASIGIRGTEIYGDQSSVFCTSGAIYVESFGQTRDILSGFYLHTYDNQAPSTAMAIDEDEFNELKAKLQVNNTFEDGIFGYENSSDPLTKPDEHSETISDSQESWGYWADNVAEEKNIAQNDAIATDPMTQITPASYVQGLIDGTNTTTLNFSGTIYSDSVNMSDVTSNSINFQFNFGGSTNNVHGNYYFALNPTAGNINFGDSFDGTVTANGFSANGQNSSTFLNGQFYGPEINSVAGSITMDESSGPIVNGTFNATR